MMSPSPELVQLLRCPVTGSALQPMDPASLHLWNQKIASGNVDNRSGKTVTRLLGCGLINDDGSLIIPVHDGIVVMLEDELIPTAQLAM